MTALAYPRLVKRVRAFLIDSVLLPIATIATLMVGSALGVTHVYAKVALLVGPLVVLEPGMVAFTGGTIGHHLMQLRVRRLDGVHNLNFFAALLRFVLKVLFGWASLVFVLTTARHQALHDVVARSIVVHAHPERLPAYDVLAEREEDEAYVYPAAWRRVLVIVAYLIAATFAYVHAVIFGSSPACIAYGDCTVFDDALGIVLQVLWLAALAWLAVRGWGGRLPGARKQARESVVPS